MGPAVLNNNWTDVLPCNRDEIDSLFKVKINRPITEDFNRSLADANCSCTVTEQLQLALAKLHGVYMVLAD